MLKKFTDWITTTALLIACVILLWIVFSWIDTMAKADNYAVWNCFELMVRGIR